MASPHHLSVERTARYYTRGPSGARRLWFVLHGYGQLAADFLQAFAPLDDGTRLLVAPEALSRFYVEGTDGAVGASWMTRADREHEIADYVAYLDALAEHMLADRSQPSEICLLGLFLGAPLLVLGILLYAVSVIRDLQRHNILGSNSEKAGSQQGNARIN